WESAGGLLEPVDRESRRQERRNRRGQTLGQSDSSAPGAESEALLTRAATKAIKDRHLDGARNHQAGGEHDLRLRRHHGGQTAEEYRLLLNAAGLRMTRVILTAS